jgi:hypothetical protein
MFKPAYLLEDGSLERCGRVAATTPKSLAGKTQLPSPLAQANRLNLNAAGPSVARENGQEIVTSIT